jgi:hypothetical protein
MTTHQPDHRADAYRSTLYDFDDKATGWIGFAGVMLGLAGVWNLTEGLLAIGDSRVYVADSVFVFSNINTWGWIIMFLGIAELAAAFMLGTGSRFARWFGITAASVNAFGQLYFLTAYPLWGVMMFAIDILIIYALVVHGGKRIREV